MKSMKKYFLLIFLILTNFTLAETIGRVMKSNGTVLIKPMGSNSYSIQVKPGQAVSNGDAIRVGESSFAVVIFLDDKSVVKIRENTDFQFVETSNTRSLIIDQGTTLHNVNKENRKKTYRVETPVSVASVKGTEFSSFHDAVSGVDKFVGKSGNFEVLNSISGAIVNVGPGQKAVSNALGQLIPAAAEPGDFPEDPDGESTPENNNEQQIIDQNLQSNNQSSQDLIVKRSNESLTTISDVIRSAGGITSTTDLSKIEIIRDVPLGKGGGKKRAIIDFNAYLYKSDPTNDIRIFDGDTLFFPKLSKINPNQIPKSILSGISPKFISVNLFGRVETPGVVKLPLESVLSDAIDLSGPIKPLSGKIVLIRYEKNGTLVKKDIAYNAKAKRGSRRNPYLREDDLISVKNSFYGKSAGVLKEITAPFLGIYSTKQLIESF